jgi:4-hydroxybenzoate polyprenyltransferase
VRFLDALAFSSLWVALAASALVWATSLALGAPPSASLVALVFGGTLVVYGVDRLRDMTRDAAVAPRRTTFVSQHRRPLAMLVGLSALVSVGAAGALVLAGR